LLVFAINSNYKMANKKAVGKKEAWTLGKGELLII